MVRPLEQPFIVNQCPPYLCLINQPVDCIHNNLFLFYLFTCFLCSSDLLAINPSNPKQTKMHYETLISTISYVPIQTPHALNVHVCIHLLQQHIESGWFVIYSQLLLHPLPKIPRSSFPSFLKACASSIMTPNPKDA